MPILLDFTVNKNYFKIRMSQQSILVIFLVPLLYSSAEVETTEWYQMCPKLSSYCCSIYYWKSLHIMSAISCMYTPGAKLYRLTKDSNTNVGNIICHSFVHGFFFFFLVILHLMLDITFMNTQFNERVIKKLSSNINVRNIYCL